MHYQTRLDHLDAKARAVKSMLARESDAHLIVVRSHCSDLIDIIQNSIFSESH